MVMSSGICFCGCNTFRYKEPIDNLALNKNTCKNCNHILADHLPIVRSAQSD